MLCLAISPRGVSKPYFCKSGGALTGETYRKECVEKRLIPFIDSKHKRDDILFWPDLATCHYVTMLPTGSFLKKNIPFLTQIFGFRASCLNFFYKPKKSKIQDS